MKITTYMSVFVLMASMSIYAIREDVPVSTQNPTSPNNTGGSLQTVCVHKFPARAHHSVPKPFKKDIHHVIPRKIFPISLADAAVDVENLIHTICEEEDNMGKPVKVVFPQKTPDKQDTKTSPIPQSVYSFKSFRESHSYMTAGGAFLIAWFCYEFKVQLDRLSKLEKQQSYISQHALAGSRALKTMGYDRPGHVYNYFVSKFNGK